MFANLRRGRLVWAEMTDPQGRNPKVRPAVVLTPTDQIRADGEVLVVAVTTEVGQAGDMAVSLPWNPSGAVKTNLRRKSEAVCHWLRTVPVADLSDLGGYVPGAVLVEIQLKVSSLQAPPPAGGPTGTAAGSGTAPSPTG